MRVVAELLGSVRQRRLQRVAVWLALGVVATAWSSHVALSRWSLKFGDYHLDAKPAVDALARLDLTGFFHSVPLMGSFSLIARAPVVALVRALGGSDERTYAYGALVCVLALAALAVWLLIEMGRQGRTLPARAGVAALFAFTPFIGPALTYGHPEEMLAVSFCVAAVLAAARGHSGWAGVALGLAIASKQWALVAVAPVFVAAPRGRWRLVLSATVVVALLTLPAALADTQAFTTGAKGIASVNRWVSTVSFWWPFSDFHTRMVNDGVTTVAYTRFNLPAWLNMIPHALIVTIGLPLGAVLLVRRRTLTLDQALSFLALMVLLRCVLDPWNNFYYQLPLMVALYARDALCARGLPLASAFATVLAWFTFFHLAAPNHGTPTYAVYMAWTTVLAVWLAINTFALRLPAALTARVASPRRGAIQAA